MRIRLKKTTIVLIIVCLVGFGLLMYPTVATYWNNTFAAHAISSYNESVLILNHEAYEKMWSDAREYNAALKSEPGRFEPTEEMEERYRSCLNVDGSGTIGYVDIPKIKVSLPLFHGTSESVLSSAIGHIDWSSLPTGGEGTHCVISGHRGLPGVKLLTDLDELREGDNFSLTVLDEVLTYEVDQIRTVEPDQISDLAIEEGKDYCTIVTCTPYGINTHRLLVRGHRTATANNGKVISEAVVIDPLIVAAVLATPLLFILLLAVLFKKPESAKKNGERRRT